ncbi:hypothetical protein [Polymorphospora sp. NPDC050346]|uniref:hypothetical protein n=1 Tax=Polymorphospora sp. NPDC050346 TaxID=3155780 RepID=UPI0033FADECC
MSVLAPSAAQIFPMWGYHRMHGELLILGLKVAASTVWEILKDAGIGPKPERTHTTWATFLHFKAQALIATDFFETHGQLRGPRVGCPDRRPPVRLGGHRARHPPGPDPRRDRPPDRHIGAQAARNLGMDLEDTIRCNT